MSGVLIPDVERRLPDAVKAVVDRKGDNLLRREGRGVALLPEASQLLARTVAFGLMRELEAVVADLRSAHATLPGKQEPNWDRIANAVALTALRRAGQATQHCWRASRADREREA